MRASTFIAVFGGIVTCTSPLRLSIWMLPGLCSPTSTVPLESSSRRSPDKPFQGDVLRPRRQAHRPGQRIGAQVAGIKIQPAIQARKFHVSARRAEANRFAHSHQPDAFLKLSIQMNRAIHIFHRDFVCLALQSSHRPSHVVSRAELPSRFSSDVSGVVVDVDFAATMVELDIAGHARDGHIAPSRDDDQRGIDAAHKYPYRSVTPLSPAPWVLAFSVTTLSTTVICGLVLRL